LFTNWLGASAGALSLRGSGYRNLAPPGVCEQALNAFPTPILISFLLNLTDATPTNSPSNSGRHLTNEAYAQWNGGYVPPIIARLEGTGGRCRVSMKSEPNEENKPTLNTKLRISSSPQGIPPSSVSTTHRPHGARLPTQIKHFRDEAKIIVKFCIQLPSIIANRNDVDLSNHRNNRRDPTAPKPGVRRCWLSSKVSLAEPRSLA
jgi:hypothetical protein